MDCNDIKINTFADILMPKKDKQNIINDIINQKISRAILIHGKMGTGKTSLAELIAKGINCENFKIKNDICGKCNACSNMQSSYQKINSAVVSKNICLNLIKCDGQFSPDYMKRILIFDEVQELSPAIQKSLLVPIDELGDHQILIFCTTNISELEGALVDRLSEYRMPSFKNEILLKRFYKKFIKRGVKISRLEFNKIAKLSNFIPRTIIKNLIAQQR